MKIRHRMACYGLAVLVGAAMITDHLIDESRARKSIDPSAMAWTGFLPYFFPLFIAQAAIYVSAIAAPLELGLYLWRRWRR